MQHRTMRTGPAVLRRTTLCTALLSALCLAVPASAQDADPTTLDEVQVQGIRESIQTSINKKRDDTVISDVLSAEDIGDLPAASLADAIETLTGASSTRDKTGASEISIRGLGAYLSNTTFNGREITNGSGDRSVNFNMFPSELINTVAIYKTQRADLIEGGVAGSMALEAVRPLDYGKRSIQVEGKGSWAEFDSRYARKDGIGWRGTGSYVDQFEFAGGGRLGVSIGVQALDGTDPEESMTTGSTWYPCATVSAGSANCTTLTPQQIAAGADYVLVPSSRIYRLKQERNDRQSEFAALQWRPNDLLEVNLDYQHTDRNWDENRSDFSLANGNRNIRNVVADGNGTATHLTGSSAIDSSSTVYGRNEAFTGGGLNVIVRPNEAWELSGDLSYSHTERTDTQRVVRFRANRTDIDGNVVPGISSGTTGYVDYAWDWHGDVPSITLDPAFDRYDHDAYAGAARVTSRVTANDHRIRAGRFDVSYLPADGFLTRLKAGARVSEADYSYQDQTLQTDYAQNNAAGKALINAANRACRTSFPQSDFLDSASGNTISSWAYFDPMCAFEAFRGTSALGLDPDYQDPANVAVTEKTRSLYLMGEFRSELFGIPYSGNAGLRWVRTDARSLGVRSELELTDNGDGTVYLRSTGAYSTFTEKAGNDKLLPSVNAAFELREDLLLRVGAFRAMSRPDIAALGAGLDLGISEAGGDYTSLAEALANVDAKGNPGARPMMSWNGDLSLEWYVNADTLLAGAVYWKQFNGGTEIVQFNETFVIDGDSVVVPVAREITTDADSTLTGFELTAAHRFSYLPKPFDGLGLKFSYNYADTDYQTQDFSLGERTTDDGTVLPAIVAPAGLSGSSRHVASGSVYWDIGRFNMQVIGKYRSQYYQDFTGNASQHNRYYDDNFSVDFRARYKVNRNLSLSLELMNLTDEPRVAYQPAYGNFREYVSYGRRAFLGVRYRF